MFKIFQGHHWERERPGLPIKYFKDITAREREVRAANKIFKGHHWEGEREVRAANKIFQGHHYIKFDSPMEYTLSKI